MKGKALWPWSNPHNGSSVLPASSPTAPLTFVLSSAPLILVIYLPPPRLPLSSPSLKSSVSSLETYPSASLAQEGGLGKSKMLFFLFCQSGGTETER